MKKKHDPTILMLLFVLTLITASLACNMPGVGGESETSEDLEDFQAVLTSEVIDDRPGVLEYLGVPDAFDISIVKVEGVEVRMESWCYFQFATRVDFVDGEAVWTVEIDPMPEGTIFAAWYDPLSFETGMTGAEVSQVVADASPAGATPQVIDLSEGGEDLAGGLALIGDQIMIGLSGDRLVYVETVAMVPTGDQ